MTLASDIALLGSGGFLLSGLVTGVWKYRHMMGSEDGTAPTYVNVAHRAALLYSFASLVIYQLVLASPLPAVVELVAVVAPLLFFALAVASYVAHGLAQDTDNQFRNPDAPGQLRATMWALIVAEVSGVSVLLVGVLVGVVG